MGRVVLGPVTVVIDSLRAENSESREWACRPHQGDLRGPETNTDVIRVFMHLITLAIKAGDKKGVTIFTEKTLPGIAEY